MADFNSSLPIRSEVDADNRVQVKIVDSLVPAQQVQVDSDRDLRVKAKIFDEAGNAFSSSNPLPVVVLESEGAEINDYNTAASVASLATSNHDYTVSGGLTLQLTQIVASGSGRAKFEVQIETGAATNTFNTRFVGFTSASELNWILKLREPIAVAAGVRVRVIRTNRDNQAQDLYSTICGHEV